VRGVCAVVQVLPLGWALVSQSLRRVLTCCLDLLLGAQPSERRFFDHVAWIDAARMPPASAPAAWFSEIARQLGSRESPSDAKQLGTLLRQPAVRDKKYLLVFIRVDQHDTLFQLYHEVIRDVLTTCDNVKVLSVRVSCISLLSITVQGQN
jgi:hypothetical protein